MEKAIIKIGEDYSHVILPDGKIAVINRDDDSVSAVENVLKKIGYEVSYKDLI